MAETQEVVFDAKSGISVEEQKEILSQINSIAEKNRRLLSQNASALQAGAKQGSVINAKKNGAFFPLAINIAAVVVLCAGALLLISSNGKMDAQVRTGGAVYNLTERALIEDIRRDTAQKIAAKEKEIASIASRLDEVDSELFQLYSNNQDLNAEQLAAQQRLLSMHNVFREELATLQEERSQILEDSRSREARLRAQFEERTREIAAAQQRAAGELDSAVGELERLTNEQERIAAIDAQLSGGLAAINAYMKDSQYDQAAQTIASLRYFCNNNALASSRSFQSKREFYNQALNFIEAMIADVRGNSGVRSADVGVEQADLQARNVQLQDTIAEMQKTIDAFNSGSSGQSRRLSELEEIVSSLRGNVSSLETSAVEKDRTISTLQGQNANLSQTVTTLQSANSTQEQEITNLRNQLAIIRQALQE